MQARCAGVQPTICTCASTSPAPLVQATAPPHSPTSSPSSPVLPCRLPPLHFYQLPSPRAASHPVARGRAASGAANLLPSRQCEHGSRLGAARERQVWTVGWGRRACHNTTTGAAGHAQEWVGACLKRHPWEGHCPSAAPFPPKPKGLAFMTASLHFELLAAAFLPGWSRVAVAGCTAAAVEP